MDLGMTATPPQLPLKIDAVCAEAESRVTNIRNLFAQVREANALCAELRARFETSRTVAAFEQLASAQRDADAVSRALAGMSEEAMVEEELHASLQLSDSFWKAATEDLRMLAKLSQKRASEAAPAVARAASDAILAGVNLTSLPSYDSPLGPVWSGVRQLAEDLAAARDHASQLTAGIERFERFAATPSDRANAPSDMQHSAVVARFRALSAELRK